MLSKRRSKGINVIILVKMLLNHAKSPKQCYQKRAKRYKNVRTRSQNAQKPSPITFTPQKTPKNDQFRGGRIFAPQVRNTNR